MVTLLRVTLLRVLINAAIEDFGLKMLIHELIEVPFSAIPRLHNPTRSFGRVQNLVC